MSDLYVIVTVTLTFNTLKTEKKKGTKVHMC